jgi:hypothetical protein
LKDAYPQRDVIQVNSGKKWWGGSGIDHWL